MSCCPLSLGYVESALKIARFWLIGEKVYTFDRSANEKGEEAFVYRTRICLAKRLAAQLQFAEFL